VPATLTNAGLATQPLVDILAEIRADLLDPVVGFGPLHDVTSPTSPVSILAAFHSRREALYQSLLASLTSALHPGGASGTMLDRQATITGAAGRVEESNSTVLAHLVGDPGVVVGNKLVRYIPSQTMWRVADGDAVLDGGGEYTGLLRAEEPGPIIAAASASWEIVSTTTGWDTVTSIESAQPGELEEDDPSFRYRLSVTDSVGRGTEPAIYARLLEVPGVSTVEVDNNRGLVPNVNGVPGKSIESLVIGGDDETIAEVLHETYECDSGSYGNTTVAFVNRFGKPITIQFSRVDDFQAYATVLLTTTGAETPLPSDYVAQVRAAVGARAAALQPGQNLHSAWFVGAIVDALPTNAVVAVAVTFSLEEGGPFTPTLAVSSRQRALLADGATPAEAKSLQRPEGFDITAAWHLDLKINGGATVVTTFAGGVALTGQQIASEVQAAITLAGQPATAAGALNRLRIATDDAGSTKSIQIMNTSTAGLLVELGGDFAVAATYVGADDAIVDVATM
jgi:uncharacterized phage protein gp47/JayE